MNSPTHSLIALALLTKKGEKKRNWAVFIGAFIPDAFIYIGWVWLTFIKGEPQSRIWDEIYFDAPMQLVASMFNSIPIYGLLALIGYWQRKTIWGLLILVFALAALLHISLDFPVHGHDAYAHFWPFSDWKFHSGLSYWETALHAKWVGTAEAIIGLSSIYLLWRRFPKRWVHIILAILGLLYFAMTVMRWLAPLAAHG